MPSIDDARAKFLEDNIGFGGTENFWHAFYMRIYRNEDDLPSELLLSQQGKWLLSTSVTNSNCPVLAGHVAQLILLAPDDTGRSLGDVYVGRIVDGEPNALSSRHGYVEVNIGLTGASVIYGELFRRYLSEFELASSVMQKGPIEPDLLFDILEEVGRETLEAFASLDDARGQWVRNLLLAPTAEGVAVAQIHDKAAQVAIEIEQFVIAHEFGHFLIGDHGSAYRSSKTVLLVDQWLTDVGLRDFVWTLNAKMRSEVMADVAAILMLAGELSDSRSVARLIWTIQSSIIGMAVSAHVLDQWVADPGDDHPGYLDRATVATSILVRMAQGYPVVPDEGHPLGALVQVCGFMKLLSEFWIRRNTGAANERSHRSVLEFAMAEADGIRAIFESIRQQGPKP